MFSPSNLAIFSSQHRENSAWPILFALNAEDREDEYHGEYGEEHAGDGADGEVEPENLLGAIGEEREEAEDGGDYGEGDRVDLAGVGFDVETDAGRFGRSVSLFSHRGGPFDRLRDRCTEEGLVGGDEVDAGVTTMPLSITKAAKPP